MRPSNAAALSRYSFHSGSSFSTLSFKMLFHISDDGVVDIGRIEVMNVVDGAGASMIIFKLANEIETPHTYFMA